MAAGNQDPFVMGRRLRTALRDARFKSGLSQREAAERLDWSASKIVRIESGDSGITTTDLLALLACYGVDDQGRIQELVQMARASRAQSWSSFRDIFPREFFVYLSFEAASSRIRTFESSLIPGLLQTEAYARAVNAAFSGPEVSVSVIERRIEARMRRQELLERRDAPQAHFILDESVIRRRVGPGTTLMHQQLEHLMVLAARPNIRVQILPFAAGEHPGMAGTFVCLEFPDAGDGDVVFLERAGGDRITRDSPQETRKYFGYFYALEELAHSPDETSEIINAIIAEMHL